MNNSFRRDANCFLNFSIFLCGRLPKPSHGIYPQFLAWDSCFWASRTWFITWAPLEFGNPPKNTHGGKRRWWVPENRIHTKFIFRHSFFFFFSPKFKTFDDHSNFVFIHHWICSWLLDLNATQSQPFWDINLTFVRFIRKGWPTQRHKIFWKKKVPLMVIPYTFQSNIVCT